MFSVLETISGLLSRVLGEPTFSFIVRPRSLPILYILYSQARGLPSLLNIVRPEVFADTLYSQARDNSRYDRWVCQNMGGSGVVSDTLGSLVYRGRRVLNAVYVI